MIGDMEDDQYDVEQVEGLRELGIQLHAESEALAYQCQAN